MIVRYTVCLQHIYWSATEELERTGKTQKHERYPGLWEYSGLASTRLQAAFWQTASIQTTFACPTAVVLGGPRLHLIRMPSWTHAHEALYGRDV